MCVCVRASERERQKERDREWLMCVLIITGFSELRQDVK